MHMKEISLNIWIQLVGMLTIVASLVFVGLEMRQSRSIALVNQIQERSYNVAAHINAYVESGQDWLGVQYPEARDTNLTQHQIMMRNTEAAGWFFFEADYFQYEQGLMTDEQWQAKLNTMIGNLLRCDTRDVYNIRITRIPAGMIELLSEYELPQCN